MRAARERLAAALGPYPQRADAPPSPLDRLAAGLGHRWRQVFSRRAAVPAARIAAVRGHAEALDEASLQESLARVRYRLRRDGPSPDALAECHGAVCAARALAGAPFPSPDAIAAADRLVAGAVVELAEREARLDAIGLAAAVFAAYGAPVHVLCASDERAALAAEALRGPLARLGIAVAAVAQGTPPAARREAYAQPVVCAAWREVALNYLQDQLAARRRPGTLASRVASLAGDHGAAPRLLRGLACALVEDADALLVDEATTPAVIAVEADRSGERLLYEQALELARTLAPGADFTLDGEGAHLTPAAEQRAERLLAPLGGAWAAAGRRRQLIEAALVALHAPPTTPPGEDDDAAAQDVRALVDLKEGRRLGARRDVVARLAAARFFRRYLHLAGVCADARGIEDELWSLYGLDTALAGRRSETPALPLRVVTDAPAKHAAISEAVEAARGRGQAVMVAVYSAREAQALAAAGVPPEAITLHPAAARLPPRAAAAPLHLLVTAMHEAPRHLARLVEAHGAASAELLLALDDEPLAESALAALARIRPQWLARLAQRRTRAAARLEREDALAREQTLADLLAFAGSPD